MLPLRNRLTRSEIALVVRRGATFKGPDFSLKVYRLKSPLLVSRLAIVVSSKVARAATERNLIKRRLRQVLRHLLVNLKPGYGIVLITQAGAARQSFAALSHNLEAAFRRSKLLNP